MLGWIGNVALVAGMLLIGRKHRHGPGVYLVGEVLWLVESIDMGRMDLIVLCAVFSLISAWNWRVWTFGSRDS